MTGARETVQVKYRYFWHFGHTRGHTFNKIDEKHKKYLNQIKIFRNIKISTKSKHFSHIVCENIRLKTKLRFIRELINHKKSEITQNWEHMNGLSIQLKAGGEQQLNKTVLSKKIFENFFISLTKNTFILKTNRKSFMNRRSELSNEIKYD